MPAGLPAGCIDCQRREQSLVAVHGHAPDLAHNLTEVHLGYHADGGVLILRNTYGTDAADPSFDSVIRQDSGGHPTAATLTYKSAGARLNAPLDPFEPVFICPLFGAAADVPVAAVQGLLARVLGAETPARQTDVTDPYGGRWTFFISQRGQVLRSVNHGTGAVRSFNYDSAGRLISAEAPLGGGPATGTAPTGTSPPSTSCRRRMRRARSRSSSGRTRTRR